MSPEMRQLFCTFVNERLLTLNDAIVENDFYQEIKEDYDEALDHMTKRCEAFGDEFEHFLEQRTRKEAMENSEAYVQGMRDCMALFLFLGTSSTLLHG